MVKIYINRILTKRKRVRHSQEMIMNLPYRFKTKIFRWFHNQAKPLLNLILNSLGHQKMQAQKVRIFQLITISNNIGIQLLILYLKS